MVKLKFVGKTMGRYRGQDPETKAVLDVSPGQVIEISEAKRDQLLADYPSEWVSSSAKTESKIETEHDEEAPTGKVPKKNKKIVPKKNKGR